MNDSALVAPFPFFGGKRHAARVAWAAMGPDVGAYVEPFCGSAAVLLGRPGDVRGVETVNDADGLIANFWRALAADPAGLAREVDWPVNECDLSARHLWLVNHRAALTERLQVDPAHYDLRAAAWWCWGTCAWIGSGWCSGDGPWATDGERWIDLRKLPHLGDTGRGVNRQLPHLGDTGQGVNRKLPHLGNAGRGVEQWLHALAARLRGVRVACGSWGRVCTGAAAGVRDGVVAYFVDPPYPAGWDTETAYSGGTAGSTTWHEAAAWAVDAGADRRNRIVLCGYAGTWTPPGDWRELRWAAGRAGGSGYANASGKDSAVLERMWLSPGCLAIDETRGTQARLW